MKKLESVFRRAGVGKVTTYINSGNVIFEESRRKPSTIVSVLEKAIEDDLGLQIKVLLRDLPASRR